MEQFCNSFEADCSVQCNLSELNPGEYSSTSIDTCNPFEDESDDVPLVVPSTVRNNVATSCSDREIQCSPESVDSSTQCNGMLTADVATQCARVLPHTAVQCSAQVDCSVQNNSQTPDSFRRFVARVRINPSLSGNHVRTSETTSFNEKNCR